MIEDLFLDNPERIFSKKSVLSMCASSIVFLIVALPSFAMADFDSMNYKSDFNSTLVGYLNTANYSMDVVLSGYASVAYKTYSDLSLITDLYSDNLNKLYLSIGNGLVDLSYKTVNTLVSFEYSAGFAVAEKTSDPGFQQRLSFLNSNFNGLLSSITYGEDRGYSEENKNVLASVNLSNSLDSLASLMYDKVNDLAYDYLNATKSTTGSKYSYKNAIDDSFKSSNDRTEGILASVNLYKDSNKIVTSSLGVDKNNDISLNNNEASVPESLSMTVDSNGHSNIAYVDLSGRLYLILCSDPDCKVFSNRLIKTKHPVKTASIVIEDKLIRISYIDKNTGIIGLVRCLDTSCISFNVETIDLKSLNR
jgi:hypothetical protein